MRILVIGDQSDLNECRQKFGEAPVYLHEERHEKALPHFPQADVTFDFIIDQFPNEIKSYAGVEHPVFLNVSKVSLSSLVSPAGNNFLLFGFSGLPTFLNREVLKVSLQRLAQSTNLEIVCKELKSDFQIVEDRVGLVTPRVICMIINEAYYTFEEGTATREDIDLAMKLGTNYPYGPFEWCRRIGVRNVFELLTSVYEESKNERYQICPLLKKEYLAGRG